MKKLKILLANNTLSFLGGSETWTLTLALALKEAGHFVACYSPVLGVISDKLLDNGIKSYNDVFNDVKPFSYILDEIDDQKYDVIIANHNHIVKYLRERFPITPIISTIHGIIHFSEDEKGKKILAPEHPAIGSGVNEFISVSEEVQEKIKNDYGIDSKIIRNFFDIKNLNIIKPVNDKIPKQFLINTNYFDKNSDEIKIIKEVAKYFNARVAAVGLNFSLSSNIIKALEDSDVVFGMGRSVLEGVAAGRLGIVFGRWGTGGPVCESNIEELRKYNFSGRNSKGKHATAEEIIEMIKKYYNPTNLEWGKKYVSNEHNSLFAAEEFIRLARELTGELIVRSETIGGIDPKARPFKLAKNVEKSS